jgi:hypothetical protein
MSKVLTKVKNLQKNKSVTNGSMIMNNQVYGQILDINTEIE